MHAQFSDPTLMNDGPHDLMQKIGLFAPCCRNLIPNLNDLPLPRAIVFASIPSRERASP